MAAARAASAGTQDVHDDRCSDAPRVRCGDQSLSHAEVRANAAQIASGLASRGVGNGDRVAIVMHNDIVFPQITIGVGLLGAVAVPINWHWQGDEIEYVLNDSGAKVAVVHAKFAGLVANILPEGTHLVVVADGSPAPDIDNSTRLEDWLATQPAWVGVSSVPPTSMMYTSGTTGRPKGVLRRPAPDRAQERVQVVLRGFALQPDMRTLIPAPLYHTAPHAHMALALQAGIDLTIMPRFDAEDLLRTVERERIEHIQCVPTMFIRLLQLAPEIRGRYDLGSLRAVVHAAAACPPSVKRDMIDWFGPIIHEYYGGTETGVVVACDTEEWLAHPGTVGKPLADAEVRIIGEGGDELPRGEIGQLYLKPPSCQPRFSYHGTTAATEMFHHGHEGFATIGDIGYLDDDGFLYITDRASDMVISGGVNIYPVEIEHCLQQLDGVIDSAAFGIPDPEFGERLVAHVQQRPGADITLEDVAAHLRASLAGYKIPKTIIFDSDLPRDESGKLAKRRLRNQYLRRDS
jgi:long-chain acyl-CoA synthetase